MIIKNLGIDGLDLYINKPKKYKVLITSCFHGDERTTLDILLHHMILTRHDSISFSYIPIANPTGFVNNSRMNEKGKNPNCGFNHLKCKKINTVTEENRCILNHINLIKECAKDGFISLHEDKNSNVEYSYTYEQTDEPTEFSKKLNYKEFCYCDNTLEDYLYHEGIPLTACLEIKSKEMIDKFISFVGKK